MLKTTRVDGARASLVLKGMIQSKNVLRELSLCWSGKDFPSPQHNLIGGWCVDFFEKHKDAPGKHIEDCCIAWGTTNNNSEMAPLVESVLARLDLSSKDNTNDQYVIDQGHNLFEGVRLLAAAEKVTQLVNAGEVDKASAAWSQSRKTKTDIGISYDIFSDTSVLDLAFQVETDPLVPFGDELGLFFQGVLLRDSLVAVLAPEKSGKSFILLDMAWRAAIGKKNVAYFVVGDMSAPQVMERITTRISNRPLHSGRWNNITGASLMEDGLILPVGNLVFDEEPLDKDVAAYDLRMFKQKHGLDPKKNGRGGFLRTVVEATLSVHEIEAHLDRYEQDGWVPDVIVIDYADNLDPPDMKSEYRNRIDETWRALRVLSLEKHVLVLTATQCDANGYGASVLNKDNFSEDKRKNRHVTGLFGINQTDTEKENGVFRLNWILKRSGAFHAKHVVHCVGCLAVANPFVESFAGEKIKTPKASTKPKKN